VYKSFPGGRCLDVLSKYGSSSFEIVKSDIYIYMYIYIYVLL